MRDSILDLPFSSIRIRQIQHSGVALHKKEKMHVYNLVPIFKQSIIYSRSYKLYKTNKKKTTYDIIRRPWIGTVYTSSPWIRMQTRAARDGNEISF